MSPSLMNISPGIMALLPGSISFANTANPGLNDGNQLPFVFFAYRSNRQPIDKNIGNAIVKDAPGNSVLTENHQRQTQRKQNSRLQLIPRRWKLDLLGHALLW